jgi:hypothetical protein
MLQVPELKRAMGFPDDFKLDRGKAARPNPPDRERGAPAGDEGRGRGAECAFGASNGSSLARTRRRLTLNQIRVAAPL